MGIHAPQSGRQARFTLTLHRSPVKETIELSDPILRFLTRESHPIDHRSPPGPLPDRGGLSRIARSRRKARR